MWRFWDFLRDDGKEYHVIGELNDLGFESLQFVFLYSVCSPYPRQMRMTRRKTRMAPMTDVIIAMISFWLFE